ncbi:hypothetical protein SVA_0512 [Sulfurifustis variabilis]|uniref:Uncharacterized protein n=1 Tax=Sulfurifustis variabilis TaxID=1675686 RepID=A0A1B4V160_9GAMM|nr:hypothetical protein [Sulfurifustis variabilis]BAU47093.1 hypothetical protein SVA_0512 [Sulfurifustis variabilis]
MKRGVVCLSLLLITAIPGCAEREEGLHARVARLESELAEARARLDESGAAIGELRERLERHEAALDSLTAELVTVKVERDKLRQEVTALRRKGR